VARAVLRVRDEDLLAFGRRVPECFRDRPRPVAVEHKEPVALLLQRAVHAHERLRRRTLQVGARLGVHRAPEEVVLRRVPDVEPDERIEPDDFHEIRQTERAVLLRRAALGEKVCRRKKEGERKEPPEFRSREHGVIVAPTVARSVVR